jgi:hypothetical protein
MKTLNVTSESKIIPVIFISTGMGIIQCESSEVEEVVGWGKTKAQAIESFIEHYLLRFDEVVEVSIKE